MTNMNKKRETLRKTIRIMVAAQREAEKKMRKAFPCGRIEVVYKLHG